MATLHCISTLNSPLTFREYATEDQKKKKKKDNIPTEQMIQLMIFICYLFILPEKLKKKAIIQFYTEDC